MTLPDEPGKDGEIPVAENGMIVWRKMLDEIPVRPVVFDVTFLNDFPPGPPLGRRRRFGFWVSDLRERVALRIAPWLADRGYDW